MSSATMTMEARPVTEEILTPKKFVSLTPAQKAEIKHATIVPPQLGRGGFGGVMVEYKVAKYRVK